MSAARTTLFRATFAALELTRANRLLRRRAQGLGVILTLHHVRPWSGKAFAPNRLLEVEPSFLDETLTRARELGFDFVSMDEAWRRVTTGISVRPFLHLTFDDGYRDVRDHALPILERHGAPATLYIASGFAEGEAEIWWLALEEAIARASRLYCDVGGGEAVLSTATPAEKAAAWSAIYWRLRAGPEELLRAEVRRLAEEQGVDTLSFARELCMSWDELRSVARDPLVTIGAHTVSHPMLAKHPREAALAEIAGSRDAIRQNLGLEAEHFAYPVGDRSAAGERDYALAAELGFTTAVTTRPGHLTKAHAASPTALPRVSLNGHFQTRAAIDALLCGTPFLATGALARLRG
ncbi:polysaccharide deacetylase family protein [Hansschlegelia sp.]|uniref:polysaccharide deacetylase family protein n=1 Tax=Hansschlegelia sp. TaxID=2041892 RepID=UPI002C8119F3|nr:polysaccharide deacetylase family protein [Hansschlegelia sp.]HVI29297.1 polysaccharide deacetylase family protein [Hansschlegelia sp.]